MRTITFLTIFLILAACHSTRKNATSNPTSVSSSGSVANTTTTTPAPVYSPNALYKSEAGISAPGNDELAAIQVRYADVTMDKLKEGYSIYVGPSCTRCHSAVSITRRPNAPWRNVIDDMAGRANLNESQKDAVYKYVLAVKATQTK